MAYCGNCGTKLADEASACGLCMPEQSHGSNESVDLPIVAPSISLFESANTTAVETDQGVSDLGVDVSQQTEVEVDVNEPIDTSFSVNNDTAAEAETDEAIANESLDLNTLGESDENENELENATNSGIEAPESNATSNIPPLDTGGKPIALKPLVEGTLLNNRYTIVNKIGGGGMGAVYLARDNNLGGIDRAVKEMLQSSIDDSLHEKAIEDFRRESMILSGLEHPSIPTIYDYFYDESLGRFYLVMKYITGGDLAGRLRSAPGGRIDEVTVTQWAIQIADVLAYLHGLPETIVYRDLKPSNIMIDGNNGRVILVDFGIARSINQQEKGVTAVGTMGYAPPELFSGQVEPRSDIYSLGSTMFHLLTGADPQNNPLLIFDFQKNPRPRQINPNLSDQMERILMRAVEYNAEHRFSSSVEMHAILARHLDDLRAGRVTHGVGVAPAAVSLEEQNVFCGFCGRQIIASDLFCAHCGARQPISQKGVQSNIYHRTASTAKLIVEVTENLPHCEFVIDKQENLMGRRDPTSNIFPEIDLSKFDPQTKISRRHARILRDGDRYLLEDVGSSNGTMIISRSETGGKRLTLSPHRPLQLTDGDIIKIGDTSMRFIAAA